MHCFPETSLLACRPGTSVTLSVGPEGRFASVWVSPRAFSRGIRSPRVLPYHLTHPHTVSVRYALCIAYFCQ